MSDLILSCTKTGRLFKSGYPVSRDDMRFLPAKLTASFYCPPAARSTNLISRRRVLVIARVNAPTWANANFANSLVKIETAGRLLRVFLIH